MRKLEWRIDDRPIEYPNAVAEMEARVAAIRAGRARELVWLLEHPPLYTAGTSAQDADLLEPDRFPVYRSGRGGQFTYHGPGQRIAYVMLDLKRRKGTRCNDLRGFVRDLEDWLVAALARFNVTGERREGRVGIWVDRGAGPRRQDRRHRGAHPALGQLSRRCAQRRAELDPLRGHRALRHPGPRRDLARGPRLAGYHGRRRHGAARHLRGDIRNPAGLREIDGRRAHFIGPLLPNS